jgi:hypothetical protein
VRVRSDIEASKQAEVDAERVSREATESELEAMRKRDVCKMARIKARAQRYASRTVWSLKLSLLVILMLGILYSFGWACPSWMSPGSSTRQPSFFSSFSSST